LLPAVVGQQLTEQPGELGALVVGQRREQLLLDRGEPDRRFPDAGGLSAS